MAVGRDIPWGDQMDEGFDAKTASVALDRLEKYAQVRGQMIEYVAETQRKVDAEEGGPAKLVIYQEAFQAIRRAVNG